MRRLALLIVVWSTAVAVALLLSWQTKVGPTVLVVTERHGVHLGDVVAFVGTGACALLVTTWLLRSWRVAGGAEPRGDHTKNEADGPYRRQR